jgi:hypothetical protein
MLYRIYLLVGHLCFVQPVINIHKCSHIPTRSTEYCIALDLIIALASGVRFAMWLGQKISLCNCLKYL